MNNHKKDFSFLDLHVHLDAVRNEIEAIDLISGLSERVDGLAVSSFGRKNHGIASYEDFVGSLKKYKPKHCEIEDKGLVAIVRDKFNEEDFILFKAQEVDRTMQGLDITGIGIREYIDNPDLKRDNAQDARRVASRFRDQGAFVFLEHFCGNEIDTIPEDKRSLMERLILSKMGWWYRDYSKVKEREELFKVMDVVHAVEIFNGYCKFWMKKQNRLSDGIMVDYWRTRDGKKPVIAGSDTHLDYESVGCSGIFVPKIDISLDDREILLQVNDSVINGKHKLKRDYCSLGSFIRSRKLLKKERVKS